FGIQILFFTWCERNVLTQFKGRTIDSVVSTQGCRQNEANHKRWAPADLEKLGEDVGSIRPKVWTKVFTRWGLREFVEIIRELLFGVAPCEIGVRLRKAELS